MHQGCSCIWCLWKPKFWCTRILVLWLCCWLSCLRVGVHVSWWAVGELVYRWAGERFLRFRAKTPWAALCRLLWVGWCTVFTLGWPKQWWHRPGGNFWHLDDHHLHHPHDARHHHPHNHGAPFPLPLSNLVHTRGKFMVIKTMVIIISQFKWWLWWWLWCVIILFMMMLQMMMEIYGYNGNNKTVQASAGISSLPQFCPRHSPFMMLTMMMAMMMMMLNNLICLFPFLRFKL